jgi:lipopolysaccharide biosynthesis glycosyltransferase
MRQEESLDRCREIYRAFETQITWVDQCIINKYAENRKLVLNPKWNRLCFSNSLHPAESGILLSREHSRILHFLGQIKPWQAWCNPILSSLWWRHADELRLSDLAPGKISTIKQALEFAQILDTNEMHKEASRTKSNIIASLLRRAPRKN